MRPLRSIFLDTAQELFTIGSVSFCVCPLLKRKISDHPRYALSYGIAHETPEYKMFREYFKPPEVWVWSPWWSFTRKGREARILALLLCAEMSRR